MKKILVLGAVALIVIPQILKGNDSNYRKIPKTERVKRDEYFEVKQKIDELNNIILSKEASYEKGKEMGEKVNQFKEKNNDKIESAKRDLLQLANQTKDSFLSFAKGFDDETKLVTKAKEKIESTTVSIKNKLADEGVL